MEGKIFLVPLLLILFIFIITTVALGSAEMQGNGTINGTGSLTFPLLGLGQNSTNNTTIIPGNGTNQTIEPEVLPDNPVNFTNGTILPPLENQTNQTQMEPPVQQPENLANATSNNTSASPPGYRVLSISGGIATIVTDNGTAMDITVEALSLLENDAVVRVITKAAPDAQSPEGVGQIKELPSAGIKVLEVDKSDIAALADSGVNTVYVDAPMEASLTDSVQLIGAALAQSQLNFTGSGITICLLDTGVDTSDPVLAERIIPGYNFVDNSTNISDGSWHGTFMARVINAVAPNASILAVKVLNPAGTGYSSDIIAGIDFCRQNGADIISMSFGGGSYTEYCDSDPVAQEANAAAQEGRLAVASTGNRGLDAITSPACGSGVVAVASASKQDTVSFFSNMNQLVDLLAPGEGITAGSETRSGTSIAAAHVSGAAALLLQSNSSLTPPETKVRFQETGKPIDFGGANYTRINVYNAITNTITGPASNQSGNTTNETGNLTYEAQADAGCVANLSTANTIYTMAANCVANGTNAFNITASNITLDCAGFSITGNNTTGTSGIYSDTAINNINITNCNISNFQHGIYFLGPSYSAPNYNFNITRNNISTTATVGHGLFMQWTNYGGGNSVIDRNIFIIPKPAGGNGAVLYNGLRNTNFTNNIILSNATGYYALDFNQVGTGHYVFNNTISGVLGAEFWIVYAPYNGIGVINNTINATTGTGLYVRSTRGTPITGNAIQTTTGVGLYLVVSAHNNTVANNTFNTSSGGAINVQTSVNNTVEANNITCGSASYPVGLGTGAIAGGAHGTTIRGNNISESSTNLQALIYMSATQNATVENNWLNASNNGNGGAINLYIAGTRNITIRNNTIFSMGNRDGIGIKAANEVLVVGNTITQYVNGVYVGCPVELDDHTENSTIANNTLWYQLSSTAGADICFASTSGGFNNNNLIINNTLLSSTGQHVLIQQNSSNNTFYWNNFTNTSGYYVNDTNGSNFYNTSVNGVPQGNFWFNAMNGSILVYDSNADGWGDSAPFSGWKYPYNDTNSLGKTLNVTDYAPGVIVLRMTYLLQTYYGSTPAIYFANNTQVNITTNSSAGTPSILITDPSGITQLNATMLGSGPSYSYNYTVNGSTGWYNTTITANGLPFSSPYLFYATPAWQNNFTDPAGRIFPYRVQVNATEPNAVARPRQPIDIQVNSSIGAGNTSIRVALLQNGSLIEMPIQLYNQTYSGSGKIESANAVFVDTFAKNQVKTYYYYYSYSTPPEASYADDLMVNSTAFENTHYWVNTSTLLGGTLSGFRSKYSNIELSGAQAPMGAPEIQIATLSFKAMNATSLSTALSNGTVFSKYYANGSYIFLNYTLTYTFYSGVNYFLLETNVSTGMFGAGVPTIYRDANLSLAKGKFTDLQYQNSTLASQNLTQAGAGSTYPGLPQIQWMAFSQQNMKNGLGFLSVANTSPAGISPVMDAFDTASDYQFDRMLFNGTANSTTWFYSRHAYLVYDPSNATTVNDTYLALVNPATLAIGGLESITTPPPAFSNTSVLPASANDTDNITCVSYWQSAVDLASAAIIFNSSGFSETVNQSLSSNASWVNYTSNSTVNQAGDASCNITVFDAIGQSNSTLLSFTIGDLKPPVFTAITNSPNDSASLDPNDTITVDANLTEYTNVSVAILQYVASGNSTVNNVTMENISNGTRWFLYEANFTPDIEGNYTYWIVANDTLNNSNTSANTTLVVYWDWSWTVTPASFGVVSTNISTNISLVNLQISATGDRNITVLLRSNYDNTKIFYNGSREEITGRSFTVAVGTSVTIPVTATGSTSETSTPITITLTGQNSSYSPVSNNSTGTLLTLGGGPFLLLNMITLPASVNQSQTGVILAGNMTNYGNETSTNTTLTWSLPSGWSVTSGSQVEDMGNLTVLGYFESNLTVSISSTATTGSQTVTITATDTEGKTGTASGSVLVIAAGPGPTPGPTPGPGGGGGGGGGAPAQPGNGTAAPPKQVEVQLTQEQKSQLFNTLATYELVRGKDSTFDLVITNPFGTDLQNVTVEVSGYLYQYLKVNPPSIARIPAGGSETVKITVEAPKYFTEGTFTLYFDISGVSLSQAGTTLTRTDVKERRTVELRILEMTRGQAYDYIAEAYKIKQQMQDAGVYQGQIVNLFEDSDTAYNSEKFASLSSALQKMRDLRTSALVAKERLVLLKEKLDLAESEEFKTPQSTRLYSLAASAFERGDYENAMLRIGEAELTYALETNQGFSLTSFARRYWLQLSAGFAILLAVTFIVFVDVRFWMMDNELSQLTSEEDIVLGLIKEVQNDYFDKGKMSTSEYTSSVEQYDNRLSKIIERKVQLEAIKKNYFNFKGRSVRMLAEKGRLEELIRELQRGYLEEGKVETRVYENRMKSYVSRLSEIEEELALDEAEETIKKKQGLFDIFKKAPPETSA